MNKTIQLILLFLFFILLQVLVLNNILLFGYINPYLYISFIFIFPLSQKRIPFLTVSFFLGLCIDMFSNSGGIHAFATLFIAYIRLFLVRAIFKKTESDYLLFNLRLETFDKVFNYVAILTVLHHFILFSFINFSFNNFSSVIINTLLSTLFTLILYFLGSFIFRKKLS
ncbi:rod shape-determining protein MreD [Tenacibaculum sp. MAR_2009_124]|uniref:rod shape-determining protein MreD n=1 Tax=Tenacibaculum sp. MAR_2009_124 TaxID=1250059 RepID=UPI0008953872|nr:rod shape-determining protein MreD [Tenacibaculum sp. MAR_2009_124]SEB67387.1 rod shape-determining protein MreD [Tenacibaculum sp. MAR_2009_124]